MLDLVHVKSGGMYDDRLESHGEQNAWMYGGAEIGFGCISCLLFMPVTRLSLQLAESAFVKRVFKRIS